MRKLLLAFALVLVVASPARAGFPTVGGTDTSASTTNVTDHTVDTCANSGNGDLLLIFFGQDAATGVTAPTWPANWTNFSTFTSVGTPSLSGEARYKIDDGTTAATISVSTTGTTTTERTAHVCYRITAGTWHGSQAPEGATPVTSAGTATVDPPSVTASWGAADNLFIVVAWANDGMTWPDDPDGYGNALMASSTNTTTGVEVRVLRKTSTSASDDPNTFDQGAAGPVIANTMVVRGSTSARTLGLRGVGQ